MLAFLLQTNAWISDGQLRLFALFMTMIWVLWLIRVILASNYRPTQYAWHGTTSVIIPVVDEPEELFREVLGRIVEQRPTEIIVVINGPRNPVLDKVCADVGVQWLWTETAGKRNALRLGVALSRGEISVLVDSDTLWTPGTLSELVKPFEARLETRDGKTAWSMKDVEDADRLRVAALLATGMTVREIAEEMASADRWCTA